MSFIAGNSPFCDFPRRLKIGYFGFKLCQKRQNNLVFVYPAQGNKFALGRVNEMLRINAQARHDPVHPLPRDLPESDQVHQGAHWLGDKHGLIANVSPFDAFQKCELVDGQWVERKAPNLG